MVRLTFTASVCLRFLFTFLQSLFLSVSCGGGNETSEQETISLALSPDPQHHKTFLSYLKSQTEKLTSLCCRVFKFLLTLLNSLDHVFSEVAVALTFDLQLTKI